MAAKIAATTAYLNKEKTLSKEREQTEARKRTKETKEKFVEKEKESAMDDFKRLQARRREAEGKR